MKQDEIIEMARRAGVRDDDNIFEFSKYKYLEAFARLVAEREREACAKICDLAMLQNKEAINELENDEHIAKCFIQGAMNQLVKTAKAIRARGKA
jgi:hypothetical protein